jgi:phage-related protein
MDVFSLVAKLKLDSSEYEEGLQNAGKGASLFGDIFKANIASDLVSKGFDMAVEGAKKLGSSLVDIGKQAFDAYGSLQQNIGGVQKLYGDAANTVLKDSKEAFKTAGMSANEYMETATQFSASLIGSLNGDTQKAAEQTKIAMTAMSDNVNTFGTNAEDVTNAFKGFSKQNYTMLDNLKLGYGGTKTEMERLIKDANEWGKANGEASNLSINSFSDVVTAIQQIQEKQHIAGTTAKEAGTTIQGSIGMAKAAWENLLSSLADPDGDIKGSINDLITSIFGDGTSTNLGVIGNALPAIETAIEGIAEALPGMLTTITDRIPELLDEIMPNLDDVMSKVGESITNLIAGIAESIPKIIEAGGQIIKGLVSGIVIALPNVISTAQSTISSFMQGITTNLPTVIAKAQELIANFSNAVQNDLPQILAQGVAFVQNLVNGIVQGLPSFLDTAVQLITGFLNAVINALPQILNAGMQILTAVVNGIVESLPEIIEAAGEIITSLLDTILDNLPGIIEGGLQMLEAIVQGIIDNLPEIISAIIEVVTKIVVTIAEHLPEILQAGIDILEMLITGLINTIPALVAAIPQIIQSIKDSFSQYDWGAIGSNIIDGIKNGISSAAGRIADAAREAARAALDAAKGFLGIHSPSTVFRDQIGKYMALGMAEGFEDNIPVDDMQNSLDGMVNGLSTTKVKGNNGNVVSTSDNYTFNIYQREGENDTEFARRIADIINSDVQRKRAVYA